LTAFLQRIPDNAPNFTIARLESYDPVRRVALNRSDGSAGASEAAAVGTATTRLGRRSRRGARWRHAVCEST
jgi:hypothetical protein